MSKPTVALGLLVVMAGAWYWALAPAAPAAALHRTATRLPTSATSTPVPVVRLGALDARDQVRPATVDRRNPFRPVAPESAPSTTPSSLPRAQASAAAATVASQPAPPQWPRLELIGLAETRDGGSLVRTAIVSAPQGVIHARPGDVLAGVYRLERIGVDGVEVRLLPEDRVVRLPLRR